ncbi:MAG TPA: phosphate acetyltransferase [Polyangiaceae bacterium]|nr:phosphate acetyltransferase [Polyangiaceae bacterium]
MPHVLYLAPSGGGVGLTSIALGLVRALDNRGIRVAFFKPVSERTEQPQEPERSTSFVRQTSSLLPAEPIPGAQAELLFANGGRDELLDRILRNYHASRGNADVVVVEGLVDSHQGSSESELNREIVRTLDAEVILVGALGGARIDELEGRLELTAGNYGGVSGRRVIACIINRVPQRDQRSGAGAADLTAMQALLQRSKLKVLGLVPENPELMACRTIDIARHLQAEILHQGEIASRRVKSVSMLARTVPNLVKTMTAGAILVTPGDRSDVLLLVALAASNKIPLAGLVLTGDLEVPAGILELCRPAFETGLPVLRVPSNSWQTATALAQMSTAIPADDLERAQRAMTFVAEHIDAVWIADHSRLPLEARLSPAAFCYRLTELARTARKTIVLPEGNEPRTVKAAAICAERGIARCVLLGDPQEVRRVASAQEIELSADVQIVDPLSIRDNYVQALVEARKHKGITAANAAEFLEDNVWLGTMMLALGEVDGLVSGAVHSTANTIRPALQIIKTKADARVVSSIFFMCLPEQVVVYGDCAVVPDPDAETLADIAIQSADSAARFGIAPRVAMISYSTGTSGSGSDVDKVREATARARSLRPDIVLDGPLQYDAAAIPSVAAAKAPDSPVAGNATVFIFPDLNTGNTTYKAVQRSAHVISIGPMLQGLRRPVNDLSRGALVDDIVYTIAITAVQAAQREATSSSPSAPS